MWEWVSIMFGWFKKRPAAAPARSSSVSHAVALRDWFKKRPEAAPARDPRYFLLYRDGRRVRAADASYLLESGSYPEALHAGGVEYRQITDEDTFCFWDELRDPLDRTVGFSFYLPDSTSFVRSSLLSDSENVTIENNEATILLRECAQPSMECVQGFYSEMYQSVVDPRDCLLLMFDWSENCEAFDLHIGPLGQRAVACLPSSSGADEL